MFSSFKSLFRINFWKIQLAHENFHIDALEIVNPGLLNSDPSRRPSKTLTKNQRGRVERSPGKKFSKNEKNA